MPMALLLTQTQPHPFQASRGQPLTRIDAAIIQLYLSRSIQVVKRPVSHRFARIPESPSPWPVGRTRAGARGFRDDNARAAWMRVIFWDNSSAST